MDYDRLISLATDLGYGLLESGAEIYRVEESIQRLLNAYGVVKADPFVIPNCIIVSLVTPEDISITRVRRVPSHGNNVDMLEQYNDLCRKLCAEPPDLEEAYERLRKVRRQHREHSFAAQMAAYVVASAAFVIFFGGTARDMLCGGLCGLAIGLSGEAMTRRKTNGFFKSLVGAAISAFLAQLLVYAGVGQNVDEIIIGALMALVPGIIFTNAIRDIMAGDMVAGVSKLADALLTGIFVAMGTGFALTLTQLLWGG